MLVVFPPTFVTGTKIIYGYNFVAPLMKVSKRFIDALIMTNSKSNSFHP